MFPCIVMLSFILLFIGWKGFLFSLEFALGQKIPQGRRSRAVGSYLVGVICFTCIYHAFHTSETVQLSAKASLAAQCDGGPHAISKSDLTKLSTQEAYDLIDQCLADKESDHRDHLIQLTSN